MAFKYPVYVINLNARRGRWFFQRFQGRLWRIKLTRVPAKDGRHGRSRFPDSHLSDGALGLWSTFIDLVNQLDDEGVRAAVILEDDALLRAKFMAQVHALDEAHGDTVALVQIGSLVPSSWRPRVSIRGNLRRLLSPERRRRTSSLRKKGDRLDTVYSNLLDGTHALLVFPQRMNELIAQSPVALEALDEALKSASETYPGLILRAGRNGAYQFPFPSDIHSPLRSRKEHPALPSSHD